MALCNECRLDKPARQVSLGVCDDCYQRGSERTITAPRPVTRDAARPSELLLTSSIDVPNRTIDAVLDFVAVEVALANSVVRDIGNTIRDFVGGRSSTLEATLQDARRACIDKLRAEASAIGAHAIVAVHLNYTEIGTGGSGILVVAASGTAVTLEPIAAI